MGLLVNFKTMQQPTILVTFFQIREYNQDYRHRASLIFYYSYQHTVFIIFVINCQLAFKLDHQILQQTEQQLIIFKLSYLAQPYLRGKCIQSNVSQFIYIGSELIIIGWAFMRELNILSPLSPARFFLIQQLIYKSKIEKHNISLDIFVSVQYSQKPSSTWENNILATNNTPFLDQISVFVFFVLQRLMKNEYQEFLGT